VKAAHLILGLKLCLDRGQKSSSGTAIADTVIARQREGHHRANSWLAFDHDNA